MFEEKFPWDFVNDGFCGFDDCELRVKFKGYCDNHYYYMRERNAWGDTQRCIYEDEDFNRCELFGVVRGFCRNHYRKVRRNKEVALLDFGECEGFLCGNKATAVDGFCGDCRPVGECKECGLPVKARGLCGAHYQRAWREGF